MTLKRLKLGLIILLVILNVILLNLNKITPDTRFLYSFKRLNEKIYLSLKPSPGQRLDYLFILLEERRNELAYVVEKGNSHYVLKSAQRYSTTAGEITELILNNNLYDQAKVAQERFRTHLPLIAELITKYPKNDDEIKFVKDDVNYLNIYLEKLQTLK